MALEINHPEQTTYFICREDNTFTITAYGSVEPSQCMATGQPIMDEYLDESVWAQILIDAGIDPYEESTEDPIADPDA